VLRQPSVFPDWNPAHDFLAGQRLKLAGGECVMAALGFLNPKLLDIRVNRRIEVLDPNAGERCLFSRAQRSGVLFQFLKASTRELIIFALPVGSQNQDPWSVPGFHRFPRLSAVPFKFFLAALAALAVHYYS